MEAGIILVRRKGVSGPVRMDRAEYDADPSAHVLWNDDGSEPTPVAPVAAKPFVPPQYLVTKIGRVFMVVDMQGAEVSADGIDAGGYAHEMDAWNAIAALGK